MGVDRALQTQECASERGKNQGSSIGNYNIPGVYKLISLLMREQWVFMYAEPRSAVSLVCVCGMPCGSFGCFVHMVGWALAPNYTGLERYTPQKPTGVRL